MSNVWVVIPAAGESKRFREKGYEIPKPFLSIRDKNGNVAPMVQHVFNSLPPNRGFNTYTVVAAQRSEHIPLVRDWGLHLIEATVGQADTIYQVVTQLPPNDGVLVCDCDMVLSTLDLIKMLSLLDNFDAVVAVTETFDPNASRVDTVPFPTRFVEKEPISQYGIVGARAFRSVKNLELALRRTLDRCATFHQEPYISMALNHYPGTKFAHLISEFQDWGTPDRIRESGAEII